MIVMVILVVSVLFLFAAYVFIKSLMISFPFLVEVLVCIEKDFKQTPMNQVFLLL